MPLTTPFYAELRKSIAGKPPLFTHYTQQQVDALNAICHVFDEFTGHDRCPDDLAYIMATCYRECGATLNLGIEEIGHGARKPYGKPTGPWNKKYYGRGPPQVTWLRNYQTAKIVTGIDFVQFPELMCKPEHSLVYMIEAMYSGRFTKYSLRNYFAPDKTATLPAFIGARNIINGTDHAVEVAYVALAFQAALRVGYSVTNRPISSPQPQPRKTLWEVLIRMFGGK